MLNYAKYHVCNIMYQGRRNDFDIGEAYLTSAKGASVKGGAREGVFSLGGGLPRENFEINDTFRCILSHCWNILPHFSIVNLSHLCAEDAY